MPISPVFFLTDVPYTLVTRSSLLGLVLLLIMNAAFKDLTSTVPQEVQPPATGWLKSYKPDSMSLNLDLRAAITQPAEASQ